MGKKGRLFSTLINVLLLPDALSCGLNLAAMQFSPPEKKDSIDCDGNDRLIIYNLQLLISTPSTNKKKMLPKNIVPRARNSAHFLLPAFINISQSNAQQLMLTLEM